MQSEYQNKLSCAPKFRFTLKKGIKWKEDKPKTEPQDRDTTVQKSAKHHQKVSVTMFL